MPPRDKLATPRAVDWDGDGDLDLVVSANQELYYCENVGTPGSPLFQFPDKPWRTSWSLSPVFAGQFQDWNDDGRPDIVQGYAVSLNTGAPNPYQWQPGVSALPSGAFIQHPSGIGDDWFFPRLDDLDQDGLCDVLFGDWSGMIWWHRNLSTPENANFDLEGRRLRLDDGAFLKVGPVDKDPATDFDALQGARTVLAADDFDRDGLRDLVVGDTYGKIRLFRNNGPGEGGDPVFAQPSEIADLGIRGLVESADWNLDGWPDVVASAANGQVRVMLNQGTDGAPQFAEGFDPGLPRIMQPRVMMTDINGDGDQDFFLPSTQGSCFVERSFLDGGYARARLEHLECRN